MEAPLPPASGAPPPAFAPEPPGGGDGTEHMGAWLDDARAVFPRILAPTLMAVVLSELPAALLSAAYSVQSEAAMKRMQSSGPSIETLTQLAADLGAWFAALAAVGLVTYSLSASLVTEAARRGIAGERPSVGELFGGAMPHVLPMMGATVGYFLVVGTATLLCCIPSIPAMALLAFVPAALVFERAGAVGSFPRSYALAKRAFVPLLVLVIVQFAVSTAAGCVLGGFGATVTVFSTLSGDTEPSGLPSAIAGTIAGLVSRATIMPAGWVMAAVGFHRTRALLEGHGIRDVAHVFR